MELIDLNPERVPTASAAFVIMYSTDGKPWENYPLAAEFQRDLAIPQVLGIGRSDGQVGFVGGLIDGRIPFPEDAVDEEELEETVEAALKREVLEEVGFELDVEPEPLLRVLGPRLDKHVFSLELPDATLREVARNAHNAEHFGSEVTGTLMLQIADYEELTGRNFGGMQNVLKLPFAGNAKQELAQLIIRKELMAREQFEKVCFKAGYDVMELIGGFRPITGTKVQ